MMILKSEGMVLWKETGAFMPSLATYDDRILKIDTTNNVHCFVGNSIDSIRTIMAIKIGVMLYWELMVASIGC